MWDFLITISEKLDGDHLLIYVVILSLLAACWYLLRINQKMGEQNHENSILLARISEQLSMLVQAAFNNRDRR